MRFTLHLFGCELVSVYIGPDVEPDTDDGGDYLSNPIGFAPPHADPRWEPCPQPGFDE